MALVASFPLFVSVLLPFLLRPPLLLNVVTLFLLFFEIAAPFNPYFRSALSLISLYSFTGPALFDLFSPQNSRIQGSSQGYALEHEGLATQDEAGWKNHCRAPRFPVALSAPGRLGIRATAGPERVGLIDSLEARRSPIHEGK